MTECPAGMVLPFLAKVQEPRDDDTRAACIRRHPNKRNEPNRTEPKPTKPMKR